MRPEDDRIAFNMGRQCAGGKNRRVSRKMSQVLSEINLFTRCGLFAVRVEYFAWQVRNFDLDSIRSVVCGKAPERINDLLKGSNKNFIFNKGVDR